MNQEEKLVTNKELAMWLAKGNGLLLEERLNWVCTMHTFPVADIDCEVEEGYKVMPIGSSVWFEPTTKICKLKGDTN